MSTSSAAQSAQNALETDVDTKDEKDFHDAHLQMGSDDGINKEIYDDAGESDGNLDNEGNAYNEGDEGEDNLIEADENNNWFPSAYISEKEIASYLKQILNPIVNNEDIDHALNQYIAYLTVIIARNETEIAVLQARVKHLKSLGHIEPNSEDMQDLELIPEKLIVLEKVLERARQELKVFKQFEDNPQKEFQTLYESLMGLTGAFGKLIKLRDENVKKYIASKSEELKNKLGILDKEIDKLSLAIKGVQKKLDFRTIPLFKHILKQWDLGETYEFGRSGNNLLLKLVKNEKANLISTVIEFGANVYFREQDLSDMRRDSLCQFPWDRTAFSIAFFQSSMDCSEALYNAIPILDIGKAITRALLPRIFNQIAELKAMARRESSADRCYNESIGREFCWKPLIEFLYSKLLQAIKEVEAQKLVPDFEKEIANIHQFLAPYFTQDVNTQAANVKERVEKRHCRAEQESGMILAIEKLASAFNRLKMLSNHHLKLKSTKINAGATSAIGLVTAANISSFSAANTMPTIASVTSKPNYSGDEKYKAETKMKKDTASDNVATHHAATLMPGLSPMPNTKRHTITRLEKGQKLSFKNTDLIIESDLPDNVTIHIIDGRLRVNGNIAGKNVQIIDRNSQINEPKTAPSLSSGESEIESMRQHIRGLITEHSPRIIIQGEIFHPESTDIRSNNHFQMREIASVAGKKMSVSGLEIEEDAMLCKLAIENLIEGDFYDNVFRMNELLRSYDFSEYEPNGAASEQWMTMAVENKKNAYFRLIKEFTPSVVHDRSHFGIQRHRMTAHLDAVRKGDIASLRELFELENIMNLYQVLENDLFDGQISNWVRAGGCEIEFTLLLLSKLNEAMEVARKRGVDIQSLPSVKEAFEDLSKWGLTLERPVENPLLDLQTIDNLHSSEIICDSGHERLGHIIEKIFSVFKILDAQVNQIDMEAALKEFKAGLKANQASAAAAPIKKMASSANPTPHDRKKHIEKRNTKEKHEITKGMGLKSEQIIDRFLRNKITIKDKNVLITCDIPENAVIQMVNGNLTVHSRKIGNGVVIIARNDSAKKTIDLNKTKVETTTTITATASAAKTNTTTKKGNIIFLHDIPETLEITACGQVFVKNREMIVKKGELKQKDRLVIAKQLLTAKGFYPNVRLLRDCLNGLDINNLLMESGALYESDYERTPDEIKDTLLFLAIRLDEPRYIQALAKIGIDIAFVSANTNRTAIQEALQYRSISSMETLLQMGAPVTSTARYSDDDKFASWSAEYYATEKGCKQNLYFALVSLLFQVIDQSIAAIKKEQFVEYDRELVQFIKFMKILTLSDLVKYLIENRLTLESFFYDHLVFRNLRLSPMQKQERNASSYRDEDSDLDCEDSDHRPASKEITLPLAGPEFRDGAQYLWCLNTEFWEKEVLQYLADKQSMTRIKEWIQTYVKKSKTQVEAISAASTVTSAAASTTSNSASISATDKKLTAEEKLTVEWSSINGMQIEDSLLPQWKKIETIISCCMQVKPKILETLGIIEKTSSSPLATNQTIPGQVLETLGEIIKENTSLVLEYWSPAMVFSEIYPAPTLKNTNGKPFEVNVKISAPALMYSESLKPAFKPASDSIKMR